jgi:tetratricopeptide (TPR) repeat protein
MLLMLAAVSLWAQSPELDEAFQQAGDLAARHRYAEVLELLLPLAAAVEDPEATYRLNAELGRAHFHLGQYQEADERFRKAVTVHPDRIETALYLQASSYLLGNTEQAMMVFREVVRSGASDLYQAVTLPGERAFLADPEVWSILDAHARSVRLDTAEGAFQSVHLGQTRQQAEVTLGTGGADTESSTLAARAGPKMVWAVTFDDADAVAEIIIDAEHMLKYTPYRLEVDDGVTWRSTPADAVARLGPPDITASDELGNLLFSWTRDQVTLALEFGQPDPPRPPVLSDDAAMLRLVRLRRSGQ